MKTANVKKIVGIALFTAIVIVLQLMGSFIKFGMFSISLVLIPIVVGAAMYGRTAGAWLGFVFGLVVLLSGDAAPFLVVNPLGCVATVLVKGTLAGFLAGLIYEWIAIKNKYLGVAAAAILCPVVNSGIFYIGCELFFMDEIAKWATSAGFIADTSLYVIIGLIGLNFVFELLVNLILSPVIVRIINIGKNK